MTTRPVQPFQRSHRRGATASQPISHSVTGSSRDAAVGSICQSIGASPADRSADSLDFSVKLKMVPSGRVQTCASRKPLAGSTQRIATKLSGRPWYSTRMPASASPASSTKCSHRPRGYCGDSISTWPSALLCACAQPVLSTPEAKKSSVCAVAAEVPSAANVRRIPDRRIAACMRKFLIRFACL